MTTVANNYQMTPLSKLDFELCAYALMMRDLLPRLIKVITLNTCEALQNNGGKNPIPSEHALLLPTRNILSKNRIYKWVSKVW